MAAGDIASRSATGGQHDHPANQFLKPAKSCGFHNLDMVSDLPLSLGC
jgi:hypothetical protein